MILLFAFSLSSYPQTFPLESNEDGGEYLIGKNDAAHSCISTQQYELIEKQCAENIKLLGLDKVKKSKSVVVFEWPLRAADKLKDCDYYCISAQVDHDPAKGKIKDYNCGTTTYDGHKGTDFVPWPFNFYKMDSNQVEVIAAAPGTIISIYDGGFDRNCYSTNSTANFVVIQHNDGSCALYWHMKKNSVTTKTIGQTVVTGEYLGITGSSGNSSGVHLHFEVWSGSTNATYIDPFSGTCNILNAKSWWANQQPYEVPAIVKASVHTTDIAFAACPITDIPYESTSYTIPFQGAGLTEGYAKFYVFLRDATAGSAVNFKVLNPDGTLFVEMSQNISKYYKESYWGKSIKLPTITGTYIFKATYNGLSCSSTFNIINPLGIFTNEPLSVIKIYPNPASDKVYFSDNFNITLTDLTGKIIIQKQNLKYIDIAALAGGMYLILLADKNGQFLLRKKLLKV